MNLALVVVGRNTKNVVENNKKKAVNIVYI